MYCINFYFVCNIQLIMSVCHRKGGVCYGDVELSLLFDISRMLNRSREIRPVLEYAMKQLSDYIVAERAILTILDRTKKESFIEVAYGLSEERQSRARYRVGEGVTGSVMQSGRPLYVPKIQEEKRFLNKTNTRLITADRKNLSFICVPIRVEEIVVGTLSIYRIFSETYKCEDDFRLLAIVGSLLAQTVRARQEEIEEIESLRKENLQLKGELKMKYKPSNMVGGSSAMRQVYELIERVAETQATVIIRGESGVGKELIADAIHYSSDRAHNKYIKVNCSALPETLIESELFGHEKGAFTGADAQRKGRFELADGGTLFLDEIGDVPLTMQVKLLRAIQQKEFSRVGGVDTIKVDVRIIAATNRDLEKMIQEQSFREDLYYRLNVFPVYLPPLRERTQDIPALVDHFIGKTNKDVGTSIKRITSSAIDMLMIYYWPGNIRELENCIERAAILSTDGVIHSYNLPPTLQTAKSSDSVNKGSLQFIVEKVEKQIIIDVLTDAAGHIAKASKKLGITERMLGIRLKKYAIDAKRFKRNAQ